MHMENKGKYGIFIAGLIIQFVSVGLGYGYSVMFAELLNVFNTTRFAASFVQGVYFLMTFTGGVLWSGVIHKFGTGPTIIFGIILSAAGLLACSVATHIAEIIALVGVVCVKFFLLRLIVGSVVMPMAEIIAVAGGVCGLGMSVCYLSTFISVSEAFKEDPRVFLTSLTIGASFGHIAVPMIFEIFIAKYFWSGAFILLAGFTLQCLPFGVIMYLHAGQDNETKQEVSRPAVFELTVLKDFIFFNLLINLLLMFMTGNIEAFFIVDQLIDVNFSRNEGSVLMSFTGMAAVLGRTIAAAAVFKCTRWPMINHWVYVSVLVSVGHSLVLQLLNKYTLLVLASFLRGTAFGMLNALPATVVYEVAGAEKYPAAMAFANVSIGLGDFLSCILGGIVRDTMGSYHMVYYVAIGTAVYVAMSSLLMAYKINQNDRRKNSELTKEVSSKSTYATLE